MLTTFEWYLCKPYTSDVLYVYIWVMLISLGLGKFWSCACCIVCCGERLTYYYLDFILLSTLLCYCVFIVYIYVIYLEEKQLRHNFIVLIYWLLVPVLCKKRVYERGSLRHSMDVWLCDSFVWNCLLEFAIMWSQHVSSTFVNRSVYLLALRSEVLGDFFKNKWSLIIYSIWKCKVLSTDIFYFLLFFVFLTTICIIYRSIFPCIQVRLCVLCKQWVFR